MQSVGSVRSGFAGNVQTFQSRSTSGAAQRGQLQASVGDFFTISLKCIKLEEECDIVFSSLVLIDARRLATSISSAMWHNASFLAPWHRLKLVINTLIAVIINVQVRAAGLKEVRDRIGSVKNTQKITEAMKLVAAAKVRRAQEAVVNGRPFAENLVKVRSKTFPCNSFIQSEFE